jgi:hypothetical protein
MIESLQAFPDYRLYCCLFFKTELCVFQEVTNGIAISKISQMIP